MNTSFRIWHKGDPVAVPRSGTEVAPKGTQPSTAVEQNTANGVVTSPVTDRTGAAAKFARANLVALDEVDEAPGTNEEGSTEDVPNSSAPTAETYKSPPEKPKLELAIDRCTALGNQSDTMVVTKWGERNAPILAASLNFLAEYKAATEAEREAVRKSVKAKSGVSRQPNIDNLPLIAVAMCVSCSGGGERMKAQRKEWGRFATVVKVAAAVPVAPDSAAQWLEKKTLNGILAEWRDMQRAAGKTARKSPVPKALKDYTHLAVALEMGSKFQDLAKGELAKADEAVAKAMAEAAADAPATAGVQFGGVAADA